MTASASPEEVWAALPAALAAAFDRPRGRRIAGLVGCEERGGRGFSGAAGETLPGFRVARAEPPREIVLEGRHRFSRYRLTFEIVPAGTRTRVRAVTHAEFPGVRGSLYRALVIGTGGHRLVTKRILKSIARRAERAHTHRTAEEEA